MRQQQQQVERQLVDDRRVGRGPDGERVLVY
jgi:hypothetical protein